MRREHDGPLHPFRLEDRGTKNRRQQRVLEVLALREAHSRAVQLKRERDQAREHRDCVTNQQWNAVTAWEVKVEDVTKLAQSYLTELSEERVRCAKAEDENARLRAALGRLVELGNDDGSAPDDAWKTAWQEAVLLLAVMSDKTA